MSMRDVLSAKDQRYVLILEKLYTENNLTFNQLADLTDTTERNLQYDIANINLIIQPMSIETSLKLGCLLITPDNLGLDFIYRTILQNSLEFNLIEAIFFGRYERMEDYADSLFISLSTLKRVIVNLNEVFTPLDFHIAKKPLRLLGKEENVAGMMYAYFREAYLPHELPFSEFKLAILDRVTTAILNAYPDFVSFQDIRIIDLKMFIAIIRIQQGHLTINKKKSLDHFNLALFEDQALKQAFEQTFKLSFDMSIFFHLLAPFTSSGFAFSYPELELMQKHNPKWNEMIVDITDFLVAVSLELELKIENMDELVLELFNILNLSMPIGSIVYDHKKNFIDNYIELFPSFNSKIYNVFRKHSEKLCTLHFLRLEDFIYTCISHWKEFAEEIRRLQPTFNVGVLLDTDYENSHFVASTLTLFFKNELNFIPLKSLYLKDVENESQNFDLIVTNISLMDLSSIPTVYISLFPTQKELTRIRTQYIQLSKNNL